jgi:hypothetical protein
MSLCRSQTAKQLKWLTAAFLPLPTVAWAIAISARRSVQRLFNIAEATNIANSRNFWFSRRFRSGRGVG